MALCRHLNGKILLNHWATTRRFAPQVTQEIDWESDEKVMNKLPLVKQQWVSKLAAKFLPHGKNMKRWGLRMQSKCPRCSCQVEDKDHIFKCPAESAILQWTKALEDLNHWMDTEKTHLQLKRDIIEGLRQWHDQIPGCRPLLVGTLAGQLQDHIGWGLALKGCIAKQWRDKQEAYWKVCKSRQSSLCWMTALLTRLMMTAWDMWNYRNKALHKLEINKQDILEANVNKQIREVYGKGVRSSLPDTHVLMKRSLAQLLSFSTQYKNKWLASVDAAMARSNQHKLGQTCTQRRLVTQSLRQLARLQ